MTIWDIQKMSGEEIKETLSKMSKSEIKQVINTCGTPQGKKATIKMWESVTGKKY